MEAMIYLHTHTHVNILHIHSQHMPEPDLLSIVEVVCGGYHTLARTVGGHVLSWGWDDNGQLGHGSLGMSRHVCIYMYIYMNIFHVFGTYKYTYIYIYTYNIYTYTYTHETAPRLVCTQLDVLMRYMHTYTCT